MALATQLRMEHICTLSSLILGYWLMHLWTHLCLLGFASLSTCAAVEVVRDNSPLDDQPLLGSVIQILPLPEQTPPTPTTPALADVTSTISFVSDIITTEPTAIPTSIPAFDSNYRWRQPYHMTNLSSFNITNFACGKQNLKIVSSIPSSLFAPPPSPTSDPALALADDVGVLLCPIIQDRSHQPRHEPESLLRITYPAHSSDPSLSPLGGSDFYSTPLPSLLQATSISLSYSIFFPLSFDFVRGGKLPGLYGGGYGCSGGASAEWCWSSRLMWRREGMGELYLYAPKAAQTQSLCSTPPTTVCGSADGQSVGRGSFNFTRGAWTQVRQRVTLNTPGEWDGKFELWKDGERTIKLEGVFWRNAVGDGEEDGGYADGHEGEGLLGLGGILLESSSPSSPGLNFFMRPAAPPLPPGVRSEAPSPHLTPRKNKNTKPTEPVGFDGIFFSTFFGGSGPEWETPEETWTWYKDLELEVHY